MRRLPRIGITCFPSAGGSGVIASELGVNLARSGCEVHFITRSLPVRLRRFERNIFFHQVDTFSYPVFQGDPYTLALATVMSEVATQYELDILHVHYAIPHAASALLARDMLDGRVKVITTLHGTDVTLVGQEPSFLPITRYLIRRSDAVTAVSRWLRDETGLVFGVERLIEVIPNFVDTRLFRPREDARLRAQFAAPEEKLLIHASNFRPVKNIPVVIEVFARVAAAVPARLLLVGDGPELTLARERAAALGVADRVECLGQVENMAPIYPLGDLTLLPSRHESFGLAALESMSCGTPVIATNRGGTGEFIDDGHNGYLRDPEDVAGMTVAALRLLRDQGLHQSLAEEARRDAVASFGERCVLKQYIELYDRLLAGATGPATGR
jgi:N-acetyl-alpha-D-glucosaminyl L-malate synthase BshA